MTTVYHLLWLLENNAAPWRVRLAARAVLAKVLLHIPAGETSLNIIGLRESL
jgi:hypothetical protein